MNFHKVCSKIKTSYITDPYASVMHYKRAYKYLKLVKDHAGKILVLGNKNNIGINWESSIGKGMVTHHKKLDEQIISSATRDYSLILCLDPILFAKALHRVNLPVMAVASAKELHDYPELIKVIDYLLPAASSRHDLALSELIRRDILG